MTKVRRTFIPLLLASSLVLAPLATPSISYANSNYMSVIDASNEYDAFLRSKYQVAISDSLTKGQYLQYAAQVFPAQTDKEALPTFSDVAATDNVYQAAAELYQNGIIDSTTIKASENLTAYVAVLIAVRAAGLTELANTYSEEKANAVLEKIDTKSANWLPHVAKQLATAIDTGILPEAYYHELKSNKSASPELIQQLLVQIASYTGQYKNFIGYTSDANIVNEVITAYETSNIIQVPELQAIVDAALEANTITGYNFKDARFDSNFVDEFTITYGHSDLKHAIQLIGLLRSEGIHAKVQFEPKTSAFIYLAEWGEPSESDTFQVKQISNGNYVAYSKEYDIAFEFASIADKEKFQDIILAYAKKDAEDEQGLIYGSWWQPLYYSNTELEDYVLISNNKVKHDNYYAQTFSLNKQIADIEAGFKKVDPKVEVESYQFWANKAFYNYIGGEDFK